jgi:hypothetical protein
VLKVYGDKKFSNLAPKKPRKTQKNPEKPRKTQKNPEKPRKTQKSVLA